MFSSIFNVAFSSHSCNFDGMYLLYQYFYDTEFARPLEKLIHKLQVSLLLSLIEAKLEEKNLRAQKK